MILSHKYTSYSCVNLAIYNVLPNLCIHKNITLYTIFKNRANRDEHENRNVLNSHLCLKFSKVSAFECILGPCFHIAFALLFFCFGLSKCSDPRRSLSAWFVRGVDWLGQCQKNSGRTYVLRIPCTDRKKGIHVERAVRLFVSLHYSPSSVKSSHLNCSPRGGPTCRQVYITPRL